MSFVQFHEVSYTYPGAQPVEALRDITFDVAQNEFLSIIGPSGCGKSTLLRLASDLLPVTGGHITVADGTPAEARRTRAIGFVFQEPALLPWRSTLKNVRLPLEIMKGDDKAGREKGSRLLELVGLHEFADKRPHELSGGMRQRVSIARALTYDPALLLMDEPFGALDQITRDEMNSELLKVWEQKQSTVLFVTHSISEAIFLSDRVIVLSARPGQIVDVIDVPFVRPRDPEVRRENAFLDTELRVLRALEGRPILGPAS